MIMIRKQSSGMARFWVGVGLLASVLISKNSGAIAAEIYQVDAAHSSFNFSVKHLTVSTVTGQFTDFNGTIQYDPADPNSFLADVVIKATSVDTRQEQRDKHLKGADFFDVEKYPAITFKSKNLTGSGTNYTITGDLTMHGVTKDISIPVTISGPVKSPFGSKVIGLSGEATLNRQDFGISWNKALDAGGYVVGDEVKIMVNIEAGNK